MIVMMIGGYEILEILYLDFTSRFGGCSDIWESHSLAPPPPSVMMRTRTNLTSAARQTSLFYMPMPETKGNLDNTVVTETGSSLKGLHKILKPCPISVEEIEAAQE
jgi:hypothetical protein